MEYFACIYQHSIQMFTTIFSGIAVIISLYLILSEKFRDKFKIRNIETNSLLACDPKQNNAYKLLISELTFTVENLTQYDLQILFIQLIIHLTEKDPKTNKKIKSEQYLQWICKDEKVFPLSIHDIKAKLKQEFNIEKLLRNYTKAELVVKTTFGTTKIKVADKKTKKIIDLLDIQKLHSKNKTNDRKQTT